MKRDILEEMHTLLAEDLTERIKSGKATSADLSVARQFLKDNAIDASAQHNAPLRRLADVVPFKDPNLPATL